MATTATTPPPPFPLLASLPPGTSGPQILPEHGSAGTAGHGSSSAQLSLLLGSDGGFSLGGTGAHLPRLSLQLSRRPSLLSSGGGGSGGQGACLCAPKTPVHDAAACCISAVASPCPIPVDAASRAASLPPPLKQSAALARLCVLTGAGISAVPSAAASGAASGSPAASSTTAPEAAGVLRLGSGAAALRAALAEWGGAAAPLEGQQEQAPMEVAGSGQEAAGEAALVLELEGEAAEVYAASAHGAAAYAAAAQHRSDAASGAASQASTG